MVSFLHSREGVNQGYPLAMLAYGIVVLQLKKQLKAAYFDVTQPWYADDADALYTFNNIGLYFNRLKIFGPGCGYYPEPLKIFLIVHLDNLAARKELGMSNGFQVCTGGRYLDGFIGDDKSKCDWLKYQTSKW